MIEHEFTVNLGTVVDGKPTWPDLLSLSMSNKQALDLISQLARMVNDGNGVYVTFVGTLDSLTKAE